MTLFLSHLLATWVDHSLKRQTTLCPPKPYENISSQTVERPYGNVCLMPTSPLLNTARNGLYMPTHSKVACYCQMVH